MPSTISTQRILPSRLRTANSSSASGHHHHPHPEQDGQHAQQMRRLQVGMHAQARQAGAQGVQRAGADVAIHPAQRAHEERRARRGRVRASRMRPGR
ncbi:hypothetical protein G6F65_023128 [Rhizopus arrhizus]|nr:hypothetical protein G6F65_023128 [Rhizopus arrhizus]